MSTLQNNVNRKTHILEIYSGVPFGHHLFFAHEPREKSTSTKQSPDIWKLRVRIYNVTVSVPWQVQKYSHLLSYAGYSPSPVAQRLRSIDACLQWRCCTTHVYVYAYIHLNMQRYTHIILYMYTAVQTKAGYDTSQILNAGPLVGLLDLPSIEYQHNLILNLW